MISGVSRSQLNGLNLLDVRGKIPKCAYWTSMQAHTYKWEVFPARFRNTQNRTCNFVNKKLAYFKPLASLIEAKENFTLPFEKQDKQK